MLPMSAQFFPTGEASQPQQDQPLQDLNIADEKIHAINFDMNLQG